MVRNSFLSLMFEYFGAYGDDGDYNEYKGKMNVRGKWVKLMMKQKQNR